MKNASKKRISLILAATAGFFDCMHLTIAKSMCYYSSDGVVMSPDVKEVVRNACYDNYSTTRFILETTLVSLAIYSISLFIFSFLKKNK